MHVANFWLYSGCVGILAEALIRYVRHNVLPRLPSENRMVAQGE
jgi:hypothetical protein